MSYMEEINKLKSKGQLNKPVKITGQEVLDLVNEREDLTAKIGSLEKKISGLEGKVKDAEGKSGSIEGAMGDMSKEVDNAKAQVAQYSQALTAAQDLISSREEEMNKLTAELETLRRQGGQLQSNAQEIANLKAAVDSERQRASSAEAQLAQASQAQMQVNQLNQTLAQLQAELNSRPSVADVEKRDQQIMDLNSQLGKLNSMNAQMQEEMRSKDARIKELSEPQAVFAPSIVAKPAAPAPQFTSPPPEPVMSRPPPEPVMTHQPPPSPVAQMPESPAPAAPSSQPASMPSMGGSGGRRVCPNCGSSQLKEMEDRTRIVSYIPKPMYAKKFVCRKCSYEFT